MDKIRMITLILFVGMLAVTSCGKSTATGEETTSVAEKEEDITEIMRNKIEISKKEDDNCENSYILIMPDYGQILESFDGRENIEQFVISNINDDNCPFTTVEIQASDDEAIDLNSSVVKKAVEDEFTKAINKLLKEDREKGK